MALRNVTAVAGTAIHVPGDDIDTDRIIPARFMKCVTFDGLGEFAFYDVRYHEDGTERDHPMNARKDAGATVLISGRNFGCGSSREHAPQALLGFGFRAIIAESFAEIFFGNCTGLAVPCVRLKADQIAVLSAAITADPELEVTVDLTAKVVRSGSLRLPCTIPESAREALTTGQWDPLSMLLERAEAVAAVVRALPSNAWR